jgi:ABC-2 type transport system permease protein
VHVVTTVEHVPPRLIFAELRKVRTTNLWWILALCGVGALALALLVNGVQAYFELDAARNPSEGGSPFVTEGGLAGAQQTAAARLFTSGSYFGQLIVLVLGSLLVTNEFAHQTATATFLTTPQRTRVILAKLWAGVGVAGAAWLATTVINLIVGVIFFASIGEPNSLGEWSVLRSILMNLLAYALWGVLGVGLGALLKNQIAATITAAGGYLIGGQIIQGVFLVLYLLVVKQTWFLQLMVLAPSVASEVMVSAGRLPFGPSLDGGSAIFGPPWWVGALILVGYGVITGAVGAWLLRRRDIS